MDPAILGGVLEPGGFDFVNNDEDPSDESSNFHGTNVGHVAINSGSNITLTAIRTYDEAVRGGTTNQIMVDGLNYTAGLSGVRIVNYSGASITDLPISAYLANTDAGKIVVLQAGNDGGARPGGDAGKVGQLNGLGIAVGGANPSGSDIQPFSNRAGDLAEYFILAQTNALISSLDGTSMSVPRVSAAAATVLDQFAFLSPEQVVQLLFNTATDLGEPGTDSTYGHGVLNLSAALSAAGAGNIPDAPGGSGGGGGGGGGLGIAALAIGGVAAYSLMNKEEELQRTILVDEYGRGFRFNFADRISVRDSKPSIFSLMKRQQDNFIHVPLHQDEQSYTRAFVSEVEVNPYGFTANDAIMDQYVSFLHRAQTPDFHYALGLNTDLSSEFGVLSLVDRKEGRSPSQFSSDTLFATPILGYSSMGSSFAYGWQGGKVDHKFGLSVIDDQQDNGAVSNSIIYESSVTQGDYRVGFQLGALVEDGSFLGGASDSALGVDQTSTYYLGVNGAYDLTQNVTLLGSVFQGMSSIDERQGGLLGEFSSVRTEGYALGMMVDNLFSERGSFGIAYSSPMQTTDGSATLTLPVSQNRNTGKINFESSAVSFKDGDQEKIYEAYYDFKLTPNDQLFTHFSYTKNPVSNLDESRERTIYFGWKHQF